MRWAVFYLIFIFSLLWMHPAVQKRTGQTHPQALLGREQHSLAKALTLYKTRFVFVQ